MRTTARARLGLTVARIDKALGEEVGVRPYLVSCNTVRIK